MNVLILGGNGYLGSKITRIIAQNHNVVCTKRSSSDLSALEDIKSNIKWISATVEAVEAAMQYDHFDYVLNMACNYGRSTFLYDDVIEANIVFPLKVLNIAVEKGVKHFLTIGTGLPNELNMYSFSKKMFSDFGRFYTENHGIDFNVLRLEMFYGEDEPEDRFIPSVITKMLRGETVDTTLGTQKRDIISIHDIVKAVMLVFDNPPNGYNEISVGTGQAPTISEVLDYIWDRTGRKSVLNKGAVPMRKNEPDCVADVTFMCRQFGKWDPIDWKTGIEMMIKAKETGGNENTD